jgi:hypothetical protein
MDLVLGIGIPVAFTALFVLLIVRVHRHAPLDLVEHLIPDAGGRYLHVFGRKTYMPDHGDSFSVYHHLLFDVDTRECISGDKLRGEDLELDSPFVAASMAGLSERLATTLAFRRKKKHEDAEAEEPLPVITRKATHTDTERPKPLPENAVILWAVSETPARFDVELRRDGTSRARWRMRGRAETPWLARRWFPERGLLVMTYYRDLGLRSGVGLLLIDTRTPTILMNQFLRIGAPRTPRRNV